jgi:hypothetical protein
MWFNIGKKGSSLGRLPVATYRQRPALLLEPNLEVCPGGSTNFVTQWLGVTVWIIFCAHDLRKLSGTLSTRTFAMLGLDKALPWEQSASCPSWGCSRRTFSKSDPIDRRTGSSVSFIPGRFQAAKEDKNEFLTTQFHASFGRQCNRWVRTRLNTDKTSIRRGRRRGSRGMPGPTRTDSTHHCDPLRHDHPLFLSRPRRRCRSCHGA